MDEEDKPGRDETWVRPVKTAFIPKGVWSQMVAAAFTTVAGKKLNGFMTVSTAIKPIDVSQPMVLGRIGYKSIPMKSKDAWAIRERKEFLKAIGQPESKVFPIS